MTGTGDIVLYAVTAVGPLRWSSFCHVFDSLATQRASLDEGDIKERRRRTHSLLDALGHCETTQAAGSSELTAAVPCLSRLPVSGYPKAILTGARQPSTIEAMQQAARETGAECRVEEHLDPQALLPLRVELEADSPDTLKIAAERADVAWQPVPAAWVLSTRSASLGQVHARLSWAPADELNWQRRVFDPARVAMRDNPGAPLNIRLIRYEHPHTRQQRFLLQRAGHEAVIDRDWGRYAVLREAKRHVLAYDDRRHILAVAAGAPLPRLLRRSVTLCTSRPPRFLRPSRLAASLLDTWGVDVFVGVPPQIAQTVAARVGQQLLRQPLALVMEQE